MTRQLELPELRPWFFDFFAGGGGASEGTRRATGRAPDVAINHDAAAIEMHARNHPETLHLRQDVWDVDPERDLPRGPCWGAWFSPDCCHFSRARGGKPVSKRVRGLAWVALRFAARRRPSVIFLENVQEFTTWGPLNRAGNPLRPKRGVTFARFLDQLRELGYVVEHRVRDAADFGAPTHRRRLLLVARRDGLPIVWPEPTHGPGRASPYRTAAECIDWSIPVPSIFDRKRPLAEATQRRIAAGIRRFVLECPRPFLVRTVDGLVSPSLIQTSYGERKGQAPRVLNLHEPLGTIVAGGVKHSLVAAWLVKHNGKTTGQDAREPLHTIAGHINKGVVACHLTKFYGENGRANAGQAVDTPLHTITTMPRFGLVATFLTKYYGTSVGSRLDAPAPTITTVDGRGGGHLGVVTVEIDGETYAIADIGMRMLKPRELARCTGFGDDYELTGTQAEQVARVGNAVPPDLVEAHVRANAPVFAVRGAA